MHGKGARTDETTIIPFIGGMALLTGAYLLFMLLALFQ